MGKTKGMEDFGLDHNDPQINGGSSGGGKEYWLLRWESGMPILGGTPAMRFLESKGVIFYRDGTGEKFVPRSSGEFRYRILPEIKFASPSYVAYELMVPVHDLSGSLVGIHCMQFSCDTNERDSTDTYSDGLIKNHGAVGKGLVTISDYKVYGIHRQRAVSENIPEPVVITEGVVDGLLLERNLGVPVHCVLSMGSINKLDYRESTDQPIYLIVRKKRDLVGNQKLAGILREFTNKYTRDDAFEWQGFFVSKDNEQWYPTGKNIYKVGVLVFGRDFELNDPDGYAFTCLEKSQGVDWILGTFTGVDGTQFSLAPNYVNRNLENRGPGSDGVDWDRHIDNIDKVGYRDIEPCDCGCRDFYSLRDNNEVADDEFGAEMTRVAEKNIDK